MIFGSGATAVTLIFCEFVVALSRVKVKIEEWKV
jgi:hypothetical protein